MDGKFYTPSLCDATLSSDTPSEDEDKLRRKLVDEFVDVSEKVKVYLRIRASKLNERNKDCIEVIDKSTVIMHPLHKTLFTKTHSQDTSKLSQKFIFTEVCGPEVGQEEFFNITMSDTIKQFNDGQNCLIFAYGITNSGKSYTIQGKPSQPGLIPRTLSIIFNNIQGYQMKSPLFKPNYSNEVTCLSDKQQKEELLAKKLLLGVIDNELTDDDSEVSCTYSSSMRSASLQSSNTSNDATNKYNLFKNQDNLSVVPCEENDSSDHKKTVYLIWVSFIEVYNEHLFDLLVPSTSRYETKLSLGQDKNGNAYVKGLREIFVTSAREAYEILKFGQKNLRIASTKLNHQSSRSHCIFNIKMVKIDDIENHNEARINKLSFCDLAGSERSSKTQNVGERLKEAGNINTSLLVLGRCIETLRQNQVHKEKKVIPYRESKLTRIFQSVFTGKGQALMIVNVHQCSSMFDETLNVMKFSAIAKQVITTDVVNTSKIMDCLTEIWIRNSSSWTTFNKGRARKSSSFTIDETVEEEDDEDQDRDDEQRIKLYYEMEQLVKDLEKQLVEAKIANALMESQIREEVSAEYAEHMNEIEKAYREQLRKVQQNADDFIREEIEIVHQRYNDSEGSEDDDDDSYEEEEETEELNETRNFENTSVQGIHKEESENEDECAKVTNDQPNVENNDDMNNELISQLTVMKNEITDIKTFRDNLILENERLKAEYSNEVKQARDKDTEISRLKEEVKNLESQFSKKNYDQDDVILKLKENVKNLEIQLTEKNKEIAEQANVVLKAGEVFSEKESEIIKLDSIIKSIKEQNDLQKSEVASLIENLKKTQTLLESANNSINEKEIENQKLKEELKYLQESRCIATPKKLLNADGRINEVRVKLEEALKEKLELQNNLENLKKELEETRLNNMKEKAEIKLSCAQNVSAYSELKDKLSRKESALEETKKKYENNEAILEEKNKIIESLKNEIVNYQLQVLEGETLREEMESLKTEKGKTQKILSEATKQLKKMLYSEEDNVILLMKEMCKKWNEINNLICFLEERLYVMGESLHFTEENYNSEIRTLTEEIHILKAKSAENTSHAELVEKLQNEIMDFKNERERYVEECRALKEQNEMLSKLEVDIKKKDDECNSILYDLQINKGRYEDVCNVINKIEEKLELDEETDKIQDDTDRMNNFLNNFDNFYKKYELLKEKYEQKQKEIGNLKGSVDEMHIKYTKQEEEYKSILYNLEINKGRYEDVCNVINKIEEKLELDEETDKIQDDTDRMNNFLNNFDNFYKKYELLKEECEQKQKEIDNLKGSVEEMHIKHTKQDNELQMHILKLEESLKQKEVLNVNISQLKKQLEEYRELEEAKFEKCEKEKEELKEKLKTVQQEFDNIKKNFEKVSKFQNEEMEKYKNNQSSMQTVVKDSEETYKVSGEKSPEKNEEKTNDNIRKSTRPKRRKKLFEYYHNSSESSFDTKENAVETITSKRRTTRKKVAKNDSSSEEEYPPVRRRRQPQRCAKKIDVDTENKPLQLPPTQVEMKSPLKKISSFIRDKSPVFSAVTQSVLNIISGSTDNDKSVPQTSSQKTKRRRLFLASSQLCAISPVEAEEKETNSLHTVVTRQLRTRNQRKNYAM
ncbi:kinesin-like protein KIF20B isoform X1 [Centruroides sculpturatus]|uniref:kinesin-like protein KIF20B isoform X1 n=1 Tax=Centruroides sculpturatus TaxID=218467 RepID=UPI000C6D4DCC|nr:kinesin-like protein KIF20B isoform X1 [Centruroides sculpturatus]XP_023210643.1 kinesin-like protein KIF20B isoform X1 [Centruroides sculpturatus]XP_023210644.1 kinesin-like protein KIF20B isoform X1 [Centruroides sculpturatus]